MRTSTVKHVAARSAATLALLLFSVPFAAGPAEAQIDWLKQGEQLLGGATPEKAVTTSLSNEEVVAGLKDALRVGSESVVGKLGQTDGFNADPAVHIPLPKSMESVKAALAAVGMSAMLDDLELKLNRAAEEATPQAKNLFWQAIDQMTVDDAMAIYNGPNDSATRYFEGKMSAPLAASMKPLVERSLAEVGAVQAYDGVMGEYANIPFVPNVKADLNDYVVNEAMSGIFHYLAEEEAAIRQNPVKRTTDILQKVFGAK